MECPEDSHFHHIQLPIVENGIGLDENLDSEGKIHDDFRKKYVKDHLVQIEEAKICMGADASSRMVSVCDDVRRLVKSLQS